MSRRSFLAALVGLIAFFAQSKLVFCVNWDAASKHHFIGAVAIASENVPVLNFAEEIEKGATVKQVIPLSAGQGRVIKCDDRPHKITWRESPQRTPVLINEFGGSIGISRNYS